MALSPSNGHARDACRRKFLRVFPGGFTDVKYVAWERGYKWEAHKRWQEHLHPQEYGRLLAEEEYLTIAKRVMAVEGRTNLLFSFEKMALRDALRTPAGARDFTIALHAWLLKPKPGPTALARFVEAVERLPRKRTRVLTWPLITVFGSIARPGQHIFLKPQVTKAAAQAYGRPLLYRSRPQWETYSDLLAFAAEIKADLADLRPRDMIDVQSFLWVLGSSEYA